jgi:uncharacterized repeat protein (TIGR02543 family)
MSVTHRKECLDMTLFQRSLLSIVLLATVFSLGGCSKSITVVFDSNGGSDVTDVILERGEQIRFPENPEREGYTFSGWHLEENGSGERLVENTMVETDMTVYARWTINRYGIDFNCRGGSPVSSVTYDYGADVVVPEDPIRSNHVFLGWYEDPDSSVPYAFSVMPAHDLTLYAKWGIPVSFDTNGGTPVEQQVVIPGSLLRIPVTTKTGHTFQGWYTSLDEGETYDEKWLFTTLDVQQEMTLYAKWQGNTYRVDFDGQGHEGDAFDSRTVTYDQPYGDLPVPTKTGHTFFGWSDEPEGTTCLAGDSSVGIAQDHTLYAVWEINTYDIEFRTYNGTPVDTISQVYDTVVTPPENPTKIGFEFLYWHEEHSWYAAYAFDRMPAFDVVLHALWTPIDYTLTYDMGDYRAPIILHLNYGGGIEHGELERDGYVFIDWFTDDTFEEPFDLDYMPARDLTIYALWHNSLTFETNGGTTVSPITLKAGEPISEPEKPIKEGYTFDGWFSDEALSLPFVFTTMPEPNRTLYAKWQINAYVVTFDLNYGPDPYQEPMLYGSILPSVEREAYTFQGWYLEPTWETRIETVPDEHVTVYAYWMLKLVIE